MSGDKPFSQACENNKEPILAELKRVLVKHRHVLEVGSGSGQHAIHFAANLPHLNWYCSDVENYHHGINQWIDDYPSANLHRPFALKLARDEWVKGPVKLNTTGIESSSEVFDAIFSANTAHIMLEHEIKALMHSVSDNLPSGGVFCQYGPFIVDGKFTSDSNRAFHEKLLDSGRGGYRDIDELAGWAPKLVLHEKVDMPANNLMLVWRSA
ncbi:DUF938 domain-containing protein [Glaciecola sp. MH2013]|uniref:DUF938 domain-containing protein n=1 Tax=Glaciecola sp. MH2013 TaxID=2785524 RepID=UPI00189E6E49|nr:DUF938 domain-containing protein [Glaciecola sp. MH2013]MBF7072401.1 DUF938 domain-containing protein [Glaciecola sp. MH2013]